MARRGREGAAAPTPLAVLGQVLVFHPQERTVWVTRTSLPPPPGLRFWGEGLPVGQDTRKGVRGSCHN